jgi:WD40 repeat protein
MRSILYCLAILVLACLKSFASAQQPLEFVLQSGHAGPVTSVALSVDGKYLLTTSADLPANLWDVSTGKVLRTFTGRTMAMSRNGKYLLMGDGTTSILWDTVSGKKIQTFKFR